MCVCVWGGGGATLALSADLTASQGPLVSEGDVCVCVCGGGGVLWGLGK